MDILCTRLLRIFSRFEDFSNKKLIKKQHYITLSNNSYAVRGHGYLVQAVGTQGPRALGNEV